MSEQRGIDGPSSENMDAETLLKLARERTVSSRNRLVAAMVDMFSTRGRGLSERERGLMIDILKRVLREIEQSVRKRLRAELASQEDAPRDLIDFLANDEINVVFPILLQSRVLHDADLIEIVRNRAMEHQLTTAGGVHLRGGDGTIIAEMLRNPDAEISKATLDYLVEQSQRVNAVQEPILRWEELPPEVAKRMFMWVSAALRKYIRFEFGLDADTVDDLLEKAARDGVIPEPVAVAKRPPVTLLAEKLREKGTINPDMLIGVLQDGEIALFIQLFSDMAGMRAGLVQRMLFEPGGEGLAIACKALDFSREDFSVVFLTFRQARPDSSRNVRQAHHQIMDMFDRMARDECGKVLRKWQRDQDYQKALLSVEGDGSSAPHHLPRV